MGGEKQRLFFYLLKILSFLVGGKRMHDKPRWLLRSSGPLRGAVANTSNLPASKKKKKKKIALNARPVGCSHFLAGDMRC